jgi:hypothetical protein
MKSRSLLLVSLMFIIGCAPYRELKPKAVLSPAEQGYIELKRDEKNLFKLKKDAKYFIAFPSPQEDKFYLVLNIPAKQSFNSFLADSYTKNRVGTRLKDETEDPGKLSVYPIDKNAFGYFWFIDNIKQDMDLSLQFRYVPQWRFKYENKSTSFKETLKKNLVDRTAYKNCGTSFHFDGIDFKTAIDTVTKHTAVLKKVHEELLAAQSLFPAAIVNSSDKAYVDYQELKKQLEEEIQFQTDYAMVLDFFNKEQKSRADMLVFMDLIDDFTGYFGQKARLAENVLKESRSVLQKRLDEVVPYYDRRLGDKDDALPLDAQTYRLKSLQKINGLCEAAGTPAPQGLSDLIKFINDYDQKSRNLAAAKDSVVTIDKNVKALAQFPSDNYFTGVVAKCNDIQKNFASPISADYGKYKDYKCAARLNDEIGRGNTEISSRISKYGEAERIVPQLNTLLNQKEYRGMLGIAKQYMQLDFLIDKYRRVDTLSVQEQDRKIRESLSGRRWAEAEGGLKQLYTDDMYINPSAISGMKSRSCDLLEDSLYEGVERVSRTRINTFLEDNVDTLENIDSLYTDSAFLPAYDITFASGSKSQLVQRKNQLAADLAKTKENEFPLKAIKLLYDQFTANPDDKGVLRARAIVAHGEHYKGDDDKTKKKIAECNPWSSKWVTQPKEYRRVYVLPITDKQRGTNRYFFRLNVRIPSEAKFPVYDVNIKLPKELAKDAAVKQWYEKISMNDKPLKNEGRFVITAPSAENSYECQITPVSVNVDQNNLLDVYFEYPAFKVFQVSVMVQKPIIKKN